MYNNTQNIIHNECRLHWFMGHVRVFKLTEKFSPSIHITNDVRLGVFDLMVQRVCVDAERLIHYALRRTSKEQKYFVSIGVPHFITLFIFFCVEYTKLQNKARRHQIAFLH